jgi:uncharacterized protein (TIGR02996 family)
MRRLSLEEAALLKAIRRSPGDDLPRLVYADWLEEHGRPERAEFTRLQCESAAAGFPGSPYHIGHPLDPRQDRINELWRDNRGRWLRELPKWSVEPDPPVFVRGFPERFTFVAALFIRYGPQLLDRAPVRAVRLMQVQNVIPDLVRCVWFREVGGVDLSGCRLEEGAGVAALASAEWLGAIRHLDLGWNDLRDDAARALARCPYLGSLKTLGLRGNRLTAEAVQVLASSRFLDVRAVIDLRGNPAIDARPEAVRRILGRRGVV